MVSLGAVCGAQAEEPRSLCYERTRFLRQLAQWPRKCRPAFSDSTTVNSRPRHIDPVVRCLGSLLTGDSVLCAGFSGTSSSLLPGKR